MIDPIEQAMEIVDRHSGEHYETIVYALVEAGLIPTRGSWGVLEAGRVRVFGNESAARKFVERHPGMKLVHFWEHDWQIVD